jgi:hypothetical protein
MLKSTKGISAAITKNSMMPVLAPRYMACVNMARFCAVATIMRPSLYLPCVTKALKARKIPIIELTIITARYIPSRRNIRDKTVSAMVSINITWLPTIAVLSSGWSDCLSTPIYDTVFHRFFITALIV